MGTPNAKKPVGAAAAPFASDAAPPPEVKRNKPVTLVSSPIVPPPPERTGARPAKSKFSSIFFVDLLKGFVTNQLTPTLRVGKPLTTCPGQVERLLGK